MPRKHSSHHPKPTKRPQKLDGPALTYVKEKARKAGSVSQRLFEFKNQPMTLTLRLDYFCRVPYMWLHTREMTMQMTNHIDARMNQRGIRKELVDLTLDLGEIDGDRYVLTSKIIDAEIAGLQKRIKALDEARKKGGVVVVAEGEALLTTYRAGGFNAKPAKNKQPLTLGSA